MLKYGDIYIVANLWKVNWHKTYNQFNVALTQVFFQQYVHQYIYDECIKSSLIHFNGREDNLQMNSELFQSHSSLIL